MFYINYEECKYSLIILNFSLGFCFILTMRNVNVDGAEDKPIGGIGFYINYEECK